MSQERRKYVRTYVRRIVQFSVSQSVNSFFLDYVRLENGIYTVHRILLYSRSITYESVHQGIIGFFTPEVYETFVHHLHFRLSILHVRGFSLLARSP
jgi:hypothetical protein